MDIIALLKAERDKAAQQVNALDTANQGALFITLSREVEEFWRIVEMKAVT